MARKPLRPLIRSGGFYPSRKWTPLVYAGGYTTANGGGEPTPPPIEKTITGNPIHITDALAKPVQALSIALEPIQDLHGYDNPWPAGGGKNLLPLIANGTYAVGSTSAYAKITDGKIELAGTTTASGGRTTRLSEYFTLRAGTYIISPALNSSPYVRGYLNKKSDNTVVGSYSGNAFTISEDTEVYYGIGVESGQTYNHEFYPQVESGSTITSWTPYSNICPISGFTGLNVYGTGKNIYPIPSINTTVKGITFKTLADGGIDIDGTVDSGYSYADIPLYSINAFSVLGATYTASMSNRDGDNIRWIIGSGGGTAGIQYSEIGTASLPSKTFTTNGGTTGYNILRVYGGKTYSHHVVYLQWEIGDEATDFAEYVGTTLPVSWQSEAGTVYAGYLSIDKDGGCTLTAYPYYASYNGETLVGPWVSSMDEYEAGATPTTGAQVVDFGGTPTTYTLSSVTVPSTVQGENNWWHDANGNITMTYLADGNASDAEALNILLGGRYVNNHSEDEPTDREALDILLGGTR